MFNFEQTLDFRDGYGTILLGHDSGESSAKPPALGLPYLSGGAPARLARGLEAERLATIYLANTRPIWHDRVGGGA